jgi:hypothetical protein
MENDPCDIDFFTIVPMVILLSVMTAHTHLTMKWTASALLAMFAARPIVALYLVRNLHLLKELPVYPLLIHSVALVHSAVLKKEESAFLKNNVIVV